MRDWEMEIAQCLRAVGRGGGGLEADGGRGGVLHATPATILSILFFTPKTPANIVNLRRQDFEKHRRIFLWHNGALA